jgi:undecaprenyl-diphosphatase
VTDGPSNTALPPWRARVAQFDDTVDGLFEPLRGRPALDAAAKVVANLSDHGFVWAVEAGWRARRSGPERRRAVRALAVAGISSSLINASVKAVVGRARPDRTDVVLGAGQVPVREPTSSSFPSGHTLAAFCVATVMADRARPMSSATRFVAAGLVGASRLHLRAHHASDVIGGMVVGVGVGLLGRRFR